MSLEAKPAPKAKKADRFGPHPLSVVQNVLFTLKTAKNALPYVRRSELTIYQWLTL